MSLIILGIDPGSRQTGYGVIDASGNQVRYLGSGCIPLSPELGIPERLRLIFEAISSIIEQFSPQMCAVEEPFMAKNSQTTIKLAEARGAAIAAAATAGLSVFEYTPLQIKKSVVGYGMAEKAQVKDMVTRILNLAAPPRTEDASDALACAICHASTIQVTRAMGTSVSDQSSVHGRYRQGTRSSSWRSFNPQSR